MNNFHYVNTPDEKLDELESQLKQQLALLHKSYQESAAPILEKLAQLDSIRVKRVILIQTPEYKKGE